MSKFAPLHDQAAQAQQGIGEQQHTNNTTAVDTLNNRIADFRFDMLATQHSHHVDKTHQQRIEHCQAQGLRTGGHHCGGSLNYGRTAKQAQEHDCNRKKIHTRLGQNQPACRAGADVHGSSSGTCE